MSFLYMRHGLYYELFSSFLSRVLRRMSRWPRFKRQVSQRVLLTSVYTYICVCVMCIGTPKKNEIKKATEIAQMGYGPGAMLSVEYTLFRLERVIFFFFFSFDVHCVKSKIKLSEILSLPIITRYIQKIKNLYLRHEFTTRI